MSAIAPAKNQNKFCLCVRFPPVLAGAPLCLCVSVAPRPSVLERTRRPIIIPAESAREEYAPPMSKPKANAVVGQSGGPTSVINRSLVGVIQEARKHAHIDRLLGARHGVRG